ncbi:basic proline-rich protein-like [Dromiciops gliroides]|uniref:basic proline-rich protein-like n=1 Tax=Dromiciops gliroides TaxID=33562 RepID=UPI001CC660C0|nr:basic proline-rich protein-like [Dromiciops gliroides]
MPHAWEDIHRVGVTEDPASRGGNLTLGGSNCTQVQPSLKKKLSPYCPPPPSPPKNNSPERLPFGFPDPTLRTRRRTGSRRPGAQGRLPGRGRAPATAPTFPLPLPAGLGWAEESRESGGHLPGRPAELGRGAVPSMRGPPDELVHCLSAAAPAAHPRRSPPTPTRLGRGGRRMGHACRASPPPSSPHPHPTAPHPPGPRAEKGEAAPPAHSPLRRPGRAGPGCRLLLQPLLLPPRGLRDRPAGSWVGSAEKGGSGRRALSHAHTTHAPSPAAAAPAPRGSSRLRIAAGYVRTGRRTDPPTHQRADERTV